MRYVLLITLALVACGKRGDLEIPGKPAEGSQQAEPSRKPLNKPASEKFFLDFLL
jgi:predicted small lipoprotein YifL